MKGMNKKASPSDIMKGFEALRGKPEGWRNKRPDDPKRHSDASRGIKSGRKSDFGKPKYVPSKSKGFKGRRITIAFEVISPESSERGVVEREGWVNEKGVEFHGLEEAADFLENEGIDSKFSAGETGGEYFMTEYSTDPYTGNAERKSYFMKGFTESEEAELWNILDGRRLKRVARDKKIIEEMG
jgi:hypothetical protein